MAVNWTEVDGSKLIQTKMDVITTSLIMARDMLAVRFAYTFGIWKFPTTEAVEKAAYKFGFVSGWGDDGRKASTSTSQTSTNPTAAKKEL